MSVSFLQPLKLSRENVIVSLDIMRTVGKGASVGEAMRTRFGIGGKGGGGWGGGVLVLRFDGSLVCVCVSFTGDF